MFTFVKLKLIMLDISSFLSQYQSLKAIALRNRYVTNFHIEPLLKSLSNQFSQTVLGTSEAGLPIHGLQIGTGSKRILIWSQMHGNESTTTKALFDLFNYLELDTCKPLLDACTLFVIPILNPDGAQAYTRVNANQVDLNRDAKKVSQCESKILRNVFEDFNPHFCFNMHGQRTIFSAGKTNSSAVVSFLSPSEDEERSLTSTRQKAMEVIQVMNQALQSFLPNQIGRYDDGFNSNCVGDSFQSDGVPTVLFEAGHYPTDYNREETRKYLALALMSSLDYISNHEITGENFKPYFDIPENEKLFHDVIIRNAVLNLEDPKKSCDIAVQYTEVLENGQIKFRPKIVLIGDLNEKYGHLEINAHFKQVSHPNFDVLSESYEIDFLLIDLIETSLFVNDNLT